MEMSLCIKNIVSIHQAFHGSSKYWDRPFYLPRKKDGIVFVLDGMNNYHFPSGDVIAKKNDIIILPANIPYSGVSLSNGKFECIVIDFHCIDGMALDQLNLPHVMTVTDSKYFEALFFEILHVWRSNCSYTDLQVNSLIYKLVYKLTVEINDTSNKKTPLILEYINENLHEKSLSVSGICQAFFISESTLMRNIKKMTGISTSEYIKLQRLEKAKDYLLHSEKSIKEIAAECGFTTQYYFSNSFKKKYGCSPINYQRNNIEKI